MSARPSPAELLERPDGHLTRSDLAELGLPRGAIDVIFRELPTVHLPGYRRPMIRVDDYQRFMADHTYRDDRVRPT